MKGSKLFFLLFSILILASTISFSQSITVKKVTSTVAIDGQLDESFWDISNQVLINLGGSNNTANFGVLWDDNYLYVGINVVDESLQTNGRQGFYDDGVEIYIDGNNSQGTTIDEYDRLFVKPVRSYWIQEVEGRYENVIHQWIETPNGYSMEFAIPWSNFNITTSTGVSIGFDIAVNDDDMPPPNKSVTQLLWSGSDDYYKNPSSWGTIIFSSETVSYTGKYIGLVTPNGSDFCINNKTTKINWVSNGITNIDIDYSIDNGNTWNSVVSNLSASSGLYNWNVIATPSDNCLIRISETGNLNFNDISESVFTISASLTVIEPLIPNIWKNYQWPYNAYFPEASDGINGHVGNACGSSSIARILHYWEFPIVGNSELNFVDNGGSTWSANFGATTYNYDNMPNYLPFNSTEPEYTDVATLVYHAATSMHDIWGSGGDLDKMSYAMSSYFNFKESTPTYKTNYTRAEWIQLIMNELDNGRILLIQGMTTEILGNWHENNSVAGHWFHIDGYNEDGEFHGILGFSDEDGYYDSESLFGYYLNNGVLIGLEPNLNGKELSLQSHNEGGILKAEVVSEILWSSTNVSDIRIEYSINNGQSWEIITNSISASSGSYNWITPGVSTDECKIKITDVSDINVYDKSDDVFSIKPYELKLKTPNGDNYLIPESSALICWESTPINNIKIEYTSNNGSSWTEIVASVGASLGFYDWVIPNTISDQCRVRISDVSNASVFDESDNVFEIGIPNNLGGPYAVDDNTMLLLHFDGTLKNNSLLSDDGALNGTGALYSFVDNTNLGESINLDGSSYVIVPHNANLNLSGDWTIEAWIKITEYNPNNSSIIVRKPGDSDSYFSNYTFELHPWWGNVLHGLYFSNAQTRINVTDMSPALNTWYHVAFIRDTGNSKISIIVHDENWNVVSTSSKTYSTNDVFLNSQDIRIGENFDGYINELRISNVVRDFNSVPVISDIVDQTISEGSNFTSINLNNFVRDADNSDNEITWSYSGNTNLSVIINSSRVATVKAPNADWNGSETITFTATDPSGATVSDNARFTITPVNDSPIVNLSNQTINEGSNFTTIQLDNFVSDADNSDSELTWSFSGTTELVVTIDNNRVATITVPNTEWNGSETITFTATDPSGAIGNDQAIFTVSSVNDGPVVSNIADQTIDEGGSFTAINLDDFVTDIDNEDSQITWSFSGNDELSIEVDGNRIATISIPNEDWFGSETISFTATDPGNVSDSKDVTFLVLPVNDSPIITDAPEFIEFVSDTSFTLDIWELTSDVETPDDSLLYEFSVNSDSILINYDDGTGILTLSAELEFGGEGELSWSVSDSEAKAVDTVRISVERAIIISVTDEMIVPDDYVLHQNYPNPFNPSTIVKYGIPEQSSIRIEVFNMLGQSVGLLVDGNKSAGYYETTWNGENLPSGLYLISLKAVGLNSQKNFTQVQKALLLK